MLVDQAVRFDTRPAPAILSLTPPDWMKVPPVTSTLPENILEFEGLYGEKENQYVDCGKRCGHQLNPLTGRPVPGLISMFLFRAAFELVGSRTVTALDFTTIYDTRSQMRITTHKALRSRLLQLSQNRTHFIHLVGALPSSMSLYIVGLFYILCLLPLPQNVYGFGRRSDESSFQISQFTWPNQPIQVIDQSQPSARPPS